MVPSGMDLWYSAIKYGPMVWCHQVWTYGMMPSGMDLLYGAIRYGPMVWCHRVWTYGMVPSGRFQCMNCITSILWLDLQL